ncbi:Gp19/Gp15/Gp42 family protein [Flaviflexus equikiangi]|uniref:Phage protein Gp19/Gp15/Gp42 n=1 Tax=Flaviflexus equikiangi TaxID=2758573 RepID=A0ABS2TE22_9ACTO|nr:Gp19/Gp15/Gp42 family protein [Flaviflexus equikiangi]MBM9432343.1 hypothetical protein [Flaviflexus equikiangi]
MEFATVQDVSRRLGREITSASELAQVTAWIDDVKAMILVRLPTVEARVEAGDLPVAVLSSVVSTAVIRKVKNPDGKQNERIDDYSYGLTADAARGELFLTDAEWDLLAARRTSEAFSIQTVSPARRSAWWEGFG